MLTKLQRWGLALDEIRGGQVLAENEDSTEARACRRHYPQVVSEMLDKMDFSFANKRATLTETTNDREYEWAYAYALPGDMATALRVLPDFDALGLGIPVGLPGEPYLEVWSEIPSSFNAAYIIEGGVLYTNAEGASIEYARDSIEGISLRPLVDRALVLELASRLAIPVKGDKELKRELAGHARMAWDEAIADDRNRQPEYQGDNVSEVQMARQGYSL